MTGSPRASVAMLALCAALVGCQESSRTALIARVQAEPLVLAGTSALRLVVRREVGGVWETTFDKRFAVDAQFVWPAELPIVPDGDDNRIIEVRAEALAANESVLTSAVVVARYAPGQVAAVPLLLQNACFEDPPVCDSADEDCHGSACKTCRTGNCVDVGLLLPATYDADRSVAEQFAQAFPNGVPAAPDPGDDLPVAGEGSGGTRPLNAAGAGDPMAGTGAGGSDLPPGLDGGVDAGTDAAMTQDDGDAGMDAGMDAGTGVDSGMADAGMDAGKADAGSDAGPEAGMDAAPEAGADAGADLGQGDGRDVVTIGDSYMRFSVGGTEVSLENISGRDYRNYAAAGTALLNNQIPNQYANARNADADIKTLIMSGGLNDILIDSSVLQACQGATVGALGATCVARLDAIWSAIDGLMADAGGDGVLDVVYVGYGYPTSQNLRGAIDWLRSKLDAACDDTVRASGERCHFVDPATALEGKLNLDGIHPSNSGFDEVATIVWNLMQARGLRR